MGFAILAGCAGEAGQSPNTSKGLIEGSRVKSYDSIAELSKDSALIAVADATATRTSASDQGIPYTVTVLRVREVLKGTAGQTIKLRQLGDGTTQTTSEFDALVVAGDSYVLFLDAFTFGPAQGTDQYVVVGGSAGMYQLRGEALQHVRGPDAVPQTLSLLDLKSAIKAMTSG